MGRVGEWQAVPLDREQALDLWIDLRRWPSFVDGLKHVVEAGSEWPSVGSKVVWQSTPNGRGRVTERVVAYEPGQRIVTEVFEDALTGTQAVRVSTPEASAGGGQGPAPDGLRRTRLDINLDYQLTRGGPLRGLTDALFIRRALVASLRRTLGRFAVEAEEEASL